MTKNEIRKLVKQQIKNISSEQKVEYSAIICKKIIESKEFLEADVVLCFMALPDEPNIWDVINQAFNSNKRVAIPRIKSGTSQMDFYLLKSDEDLQNQFISGSYNILEPKDDLEKFKFCDEEKTLFLIPGVAFTNDGNRLGRGKGFYDIYLSKIIENCRKKNCCFMGVCFDVQKMDFLPTDIHDVKMDKVI